MCSFKGDDLRIPTQTEFYQKSKLFAALLWIVSVSVILV